MPIEVDGVGGGQVRSARSLGKRLAIDLDSDSDEEEPATFWGGAGGVHFSGNAKDNVAGGDGRHAKGDINSIRAEVEGYIFGQAPVRLQGRARAQLAFMDEAQVVAIHGILVVQPPVVVVGGAAGTGKSALLELIAMTEASEPFWADF